ncbi:MAG: AraC family transcriptional regulator [Bacteroidota bacterium]
MKTIEIIEKEKQSIIEQLNNYIEGFIEESNGEEVLRFDNGLGVGSIRNIHFDWGIALLDYDVKFNHDVKIIFSFEKGRNPIEFLFISEGSIAFSNSFDQEVTKLERFQNIIIGNDSETKSIYYFPNNERVRLNIIHVFAKEFMKKSNAQVDSLEKSLLAVFKGEEKNLPFKHIGNYNLKIADKIKALNKLKGSGIIKNLSIEGQLNLILAMQMLEHENFKKEIPLPHSLSVSDIKKIHALTDFILDNISKTITIQTLVEESGLSPKKLQTGFKLLYSQSINNYIRKIKLELSRDMLKNTDMTISEIVFAIGYRSRSYFSKIFSEYYDILPIEYREQIKKISKIKS